MSEEGRSKREEKRERLLLAALLDVPFDGWTDRALFRGAEAEGFSRADARRLFPGGGDQLLAEFGAYIDRRTIEELKKLDLASMRVRDRVAAAIRIKLDLLEPHKEAVQRAAAATVLPQNLPRALSGVYDISDAIWWAIGDKSTDFSFYTKRATLAWVIASTLLYWLNDRSEDHHDTRAFLDRRLDDVMRVGRMRQATSQTAGFVTAPFRFVTRGFRRH